MTWKPEWKILNLVIGIATLTVTFTCKPDKINTLAWGKKKKWLLMSLSIIA